VTEALSPPYCQPYWRASPPYTPPFCPPYSYPAYSPSGSQLLPCIKQEPGEEVAAWPGCRVSSPGERPPQATTSKISYDPTTIRPYDRRHEDFGDLVRIKVENTVGENIQEMIERYVHKKLRQQRRFSLKFNEFEMDFCSKDLEINDPSTRKRKSVIVRAGEVKIELPKDIIDDAIDCDASKEVIELVDIDPTSFGDMLGNIIDEADDLLMNAELHTG
jgi:hypothetical protein